MEGLTFEEHYNGLISVPVLDPVTQTIDITPYLIIGGIVIITLIIANNNINNWVAPNLKEKK